LGTYVRAVCLDSSGGWRTISLGRMVAVHETLQERSCMFGFTAVRNAIIAMILVCVIFPSQLIAQVNTKRFSEMDSYDAYLLVQSTGCTAVAQKQENYGKRNVMNISCTEDPSAKPLALGPRYGRGLPENIEVRFNMELTPELKKNTGVSLSWTTSALGAPVNRDLAERCLRRLLESVGVEEPDAIVAEFFRDAPMNDRSYGLEFRRSGRRISVGRSGESRSDAVEVHTIWISD
jgi:hypothetical protein